MMERHLTDAELVDTLEVSSGVRRAHLDTCARCRAEYERLQATLTGLAIEAQDWADRPDAAWDRQARQIFARARARHVHVPRWRWALVPALGLAALVGVWWHGQGTPPSGSVESDDALLNAVQQSIHAIVPAPMQPIALLAREVEASATPPTEVRRQGG